MQNILVAVHSILRWIILLMLLVSILKSYSGWQQKKKFSDGDRKTWLFTLIFSHLTLLLGLYQVFLGRFGIFSTTLPEGISVMKDKFYRFYWVEHPVMMILAIILITMAYGSAKKPIADEAKYKRAFWLFFIALIFILASIPWPFREIIGRSLLPH
jgi:hypothetical protein